MNTEKLSALEGEKPRRKEGGKQFQIYALAKNSETETEAIHQRKREDKDPPFIEMTNS